VGLPWLGDDLSANGARLVADRLFGASEPAMLWLVPVAALAGLAAALWGLAVPERARLASAAGFVCGLAGLCYFLAALVQRRPASAGLGQWLGLAFTLGLVLQPWLTGLRWLLPRITFPARALPYLFLAPGLGLYLFWIVGPALHTLHLSLTDWDGVTPARWVGLVNFQRLLLSDPVFAEAVINNLRWLLVFVTGPTVLGLLLALTFHAASPKLGHFKTGFYAPLALSFPVIGLVWAWLYNPRLGLINTLLAALGVEALPGWLADPNLALWCIIAAAAWRQVGYVLLLYLAGLQTIDPNLLDAAIVDGASPGRLLRHVLLPLLSPITTIVLIIAVIDSLRAFDMVQVMTRGGQGTQVLATFMYLEAFTNYRMGYGAAIAVTLFALSSLFIGVYLARVLRAEAEA
jgi:multiple sugar transport system permease protein